MRRVFRSSSYSERPFRSRGPRAANRSAKPDCPRTPVGQLRFVDEQQVIHDLARDALHHQGDAFLFSWGRGEGRVERRIRRACLPAGARQQIRHADLVREHQVGDDVARERPIPVGVEQPFNRREFAAAPSVERGDLDCPCAWPSRCCRSRTSHRTVVRASRSVIHETRKAESCDGSGRVVLNIRRPGTRERIASHVTAQTDERRA